MDVNLEQLYPAKKGKTARFQVDQVGDKDEEDGTKNNADCNMLTHQKGDTYFTYANKSLRHYLSRDVLPRENNYRNLLSKSSFRGQKRRPTMEQLREEEMEQYTKPPDAESPNVKIIKKGKIVKLGWISGVFVSTTYSSFEDVYALV